MSDAQKVEVVRDGLEGMFANEKLALQKVLTDYPESKGWKHSNSVFGYLIGLGFSPLRANQLQDEYLTEERKSAR